MMSLESRFSGAISPRTLSLIIVSLTAIISAQRFTIPLLSSFSLLVPFFMALLWFRSSPRLSNTLLLISLFFSIDNQVAHFAVTLPPLRHLLYATIVFSFLRDHKFTTKRLIILSLHFLFLLGKHSHLLEKIDGNQLIRDVQILILVVIILAKSNRQYMIDIPFASQCILVFMLSELPNFFVYRDYWLTDYMSYDSTKYLIVLPSIHLLIKGRTASSFAVAIPTTIILIGYTSRMLMLSYFWLLPPQSFSSRSGKNKKNYLSHSWGNNSLIANIVYKCWK